MKRIATIAVIAAAVAAPAASGLQAASATSSGTTVVRSEREVRIVGTITKLTARKLSVTSGARKVTFVIPAGFDLGGNGRGDRVEAEGRKAGGKLTLTSLHGEDRVSAARRGGDDGPGHDAGDDHGHHGGGHHGGGHDDGPNHH
jgi:hypothetical protein